MPDVAGHKHKVQLFIYLFILQIPPPPLINDFI